jgi:hypothetical protein
METISVNGQSIDVSGMVNDGELTLEEIRQAYTQAGGNPTQISNVVVSEESTVELSECVTDSN